MGVAADSLLALPSPDIHTRLEDGTLNYQAIAGDMGVDVTWL